ncbi:MAG: hypothetical protein JOZ39_12490 [Chloroflexi bacterium]|nr:hypothetical protein [Chloroflexota bacterium]
MFRSAEVPEAALRRLEELAERHGKAVLTGPVFDTIKLTADSVVVATLDRDQLRWPLAWACQSDQAPLTDPPAADWFLDAVTFEQ